MKLFDTHCHLAGSELIGQAQELAARAVSGGVMGMCVVAADEPSLRAVAGLVTELRAKLPSARIVGTSGIHPHESTDVGPELWDLICTNARALAAVGETGLDYYYDHSDRALQRDLFARHIELACELKKPLVIHCRQAAADVLALLDRPEVRNHPNPGILHCFTEDLPTAKKLVDLGFTISFSGIVSFKNAQPLRDVAAQVPLERLLIETDSPWLAPIPHRGKTNEPAFVAHTFEVLAQLRPESREELSAALWQNSCRMFGVPT